MRRKDSEEMDGETARQTDRQMERQRLVEKRRDTGEETERP